MHHAVDVAERTAKRRAVPDVAEDVVGIRREIGRRTAALAMHLRRPVIKNSDLVTRSEQLVRNM
jgi:hypothetical protein